MNIEPDVSLAKANNYSWPTDGLTLLNGDGPWEFNAIPGVIQGRNPDWNHLAEGFKLAADCIINDTEYNHRTIDLLLYPILHLYRHSLELSLKGIIYRSEQLLDRTPMIRTTHALCALWENCKTVVSEFYEDRIRPEFPIIEKCIEELNSLDSTSMALRYPQDRNGLPFQLEPERINLLHLRDSFDAVHNVLDCIDTDLACKLDSLLEMRGDCGW